VNVTNGTTMFHPFMMPESESRMALAIPVTTPPVPRTMSSIAVLFATVSNADWYSTWTA
jgi:hypothetical protein